MDLTELNIKFGPLEEQLVLEVISYITNSCPKISSIGSLRDGSQLIDIISIYERQTRWQSSHVIDLFFKFKNDVVNCYDFINGWINTYYECDFVVVADEMRYANNRDVMVISLLILNVLYTRRQSLNTDLKIRLEAFWIDFSLIVDSIVVWIRTRAQLINCHSSLHSCAHQLFSGHSLFEYQSIQQRLTSMVQQKLIEEQSKRLEEKELYIQKQNKDYSELGTKMLQLIQEFNELKKSNASLVQEVKWQKGINSELNDMIVKLKEENDALNKMLIKENGISDSVSSDGISSEKSQTYHTPDSTDAEQKPSEDDTFDDNLESNSELLLNNYDRDSNLNDLDVNTSFHSNSGSKIDDNCGLDIDCNIGMTEKLDDTDSSTEDITDSGNHSDAAADDILVEIYQGCLPKEHNNNNNNNNSNNHNNNNNINMNRDHSKEGVFSFNSWQEFFANDSNNDNEFQNGQQKDTYNNKSNQSLGTNDKRCINFI